MGKKEWSRGYFEDGEIIEVGDRKEQEMSLFGQLNRGLGGRED